MNQTRQQMPRDPFRNASNIALRLLEELTGLPENSVAMDQNYLALGCGEFRVISASSRNGMTTVDIEAQYEFDRTKHQADWILNNCAMELVVQIDCLAFQNGYNYTAQTKKDFIDLYDKSLILIDSLGMIERLGIDKFMYFNSIDTSKGPLRNNRTAKFYSYSWHETAKIALSEKPPDEKWKDFVNTIRQFCNLLNSGFLKFGLHENLTWQEVINEAINNKML